MARLIRRALAVLVVDDHALVRSGMRMLLEDNDAIFEVAEASSGEEGVEIAMEGEFDIVLMDISLPGISGQEAAEQLLKRKPQTRIIMVTGKAELGPLRQLLSAGVSGYVTKGSTSSEMEEAIETVMGGKQYLSPDVARQLAMDTIHGETNSNPFDRLTTRELEVVRLLLRGLRNRQISRSLHISEKTVSTHRVRSFEKLGIENTAALVRMAMQNGLWSDD